MLQNILNKTPPQNGVLKLFKSNTTPVESDTEATYTEANFAGYASVTLAPGSWTVTPGAPTSAAYPEQTFTASGGVQNIYGYYVVQETSGKILFAERFTNGPYAIQVGSPIKVTLNFTGQ